MFCYAESNWATGNVNHEQYYATPNGVDFYLKAIKEQGYFGTYDIWTELYQASVSDGKINITKILESDNGINWISMTEEIMYIGEANSDILPGGNFYFWYETELEKINLGRAFLKPLNSIENNLWTVSYYGAQGKRFKICQYNNTFKVYKITDDSEEFLFKTYNLKRYDTLFVLNSGSCKSDAMQIYDINGERLMEVPFNSNDSDIIIKDNDVYFVKSKNVMKYNFQTKEFKLIFESTYEGVDDIHIFLLNDKLYILDKPNRCIQVYSIEEEEIKESIYVPKEMVKAIGEYFVVANNYIITSSKREALLFCLNIESKKLHKYILE